MSRHEMIAQTIENLDSIDFYDRIMFNAGICNSEVLSNMVIQDKLLAQLERLDYDAYLCYIVDDRATIEKYYTKKEENA